MERVRFVKGKNNNVLIVVPHGHDDPNTPIIGERIADELECPVLVNYGWERADKFDYDLDKANCNNISHIQEDVICGEFLKPILNYVKNAVHPNIFIIHGVSNLIKNQTPNNKLDVIVGYGEGIKPSYSCDFEFKENFMETLKNKAGFAMFQGIADGKYSGRGYNNLNQLFRRKQYLCSDCNSMQLEIVKSRRYDVASSKHTADSIAIAIEDTITKPMSSKNRNKQLWNTSKFAFI